MLAAVLAFQITFALAFVLIFALAFTFARCRDGSDCCFCR